MPARGPVTIETIEAGEVLGWSWLFPPYRWHFDARALSVVRATGFDGACLREKCESDPALGYDADGPLRAGADRAPAMDAAPAPRRLWQRRPSLSCSGPGAMVPAPFRVAEREQDTADTWTLTLEPLSGPGPSIAPGQFMMVYAFGIGEVPISVSGPPGRPGPVVLTVRAVGAVTHCHLQRRARHDARASRPVRRRPGRSRLRAVTTSSSWPAASGSRRCGRSSCASSSSAPATATPPSSTERARLRICSTRASTTNGGARSTSR